MAENKMEQVAAMFGKKLGERFTVNIQGKEHRKPYHGAKAVDKTCRNHGSCEHLDSDWGLIDDGNNDMS